MTDIDTYFRTIGDVSTTLTFIYLVHMADKEGKVNVTYGDMSKVFKRSRTMMYKYVARLVELGLIEQRGKQAVNKRLTNGEQKGTQIYISQIACYKQVMDIGKHNDINKRLTNGKQAVNKRLTSQMNPKRTLEDRRQSFYDALIPYLNEYDKKMIREFFDYWSQVNEGGRKMHFEKQKTFEIGKRLATWKRNEVERQRPQRAEDIGIVLNNVKNKFDDEEEF